MLGVVFEALPFALWHQLWCSGSMLNIDIHHIESHTASVDNNVCHGPTESVEFLQLHFAKRHDVVSMHALLKLLCKLG